MGTSILKIKNMLNGDLSRIRNVIRFSNSTKIKDESVAEHSYFAAYYALILAHALQQTEVVAIDYGKMLARALLHDLDESISGDFIRHFKYTDPELHSMLDEASRKLMKQEAFLDLFTAKYACTEDGKGLIKQLYTYWNDAKLSGIEGDIVAFADFLSVLSYVMNEIDCGNHKLIQQLDDMYEYAESFNKRGIFQDYEEPKRWLQQVMFILNEYIGGDRD